MVGSCGATKNTGPGAHYRLCVSSGDKTLKKTSLQSAFGDFGDIVLIETSRAGIAFVAYSDKEDALDAMKTMDGQTVDGCAVKVSQADAKGPVRVKAGPKLTNHPEPTKSVSTKHADMDRNRHQESHAQTARRDPPRIESEPRATRSMSRGPGHREPCRGRGGSGRRASRTRSGRGQSEQRLPNSRTSRHDHSEPSCARSRSRSRALQQRNDKDRRELQPSRRSRSRHDYYEPSRGKSWSSPPASQPWNAGRRSDSRPPIRNRRRHDSEPRLGRSRSVRQMSARSRD